MVVARGADGGYSAFDTVENRHRNHILDLTLAPARIPEAVHSRAQAIARRVADALDLVGLLAVEMFVDRDGKVLVNEIAPRPHNSGHWTIDACPASQFELHIRAIAGLPLPPAVRHSDAVMKNLVGPEETALWPAILATPGLIPHLYGKTGGPARAQDGARHATVPERLAAGRVRDCRGVGRATGARRVRNGDAAHCGGRDARQARAQGRRAPGAEKAAGRVTAVTRLSFCAATARQPLRRGVGLCGWWRPSRQDELPTPAMLQGRWRI